MNGTPDESQRFVERPVSNEPISNPAQLGYESPRDQIARMPPVNVLGAVFMFLVGFGLAAFVVFFISVVIAPFNIHEPQPKHYAALGVYAVLEIATIGMLIWKIRSPGWRTAGRWGVLGALLGAGIFLLLGGICFAGT